MKIKIIILIIFCVFFTAFLNTPVEGHEQASIEYHRGEITEVLEKQDTQIQGLDQVQQYKRFEVELISTGETIKTDMSGFESEIGELYNEGDSIILSSYSSKDYETVYSIVSFDRQDTLIILFIIFALVALLICYKRTIGAILGLVFSFLVIFTFLIPRILEGGNPISLSIISAILIIPVIFFLSHGFNKKTNIAILSTIFALLITGVFASIFMSAAQITGFEMEEANFIRTMLDKNIRLDGLLLAGVIIATLGVLNDVTVSQVAIVQQISEVGKKISIKEIFSRSMKIGKDHMASMINTLVLVYSGASMPILIIFISSDLPISYILSLETISMEIIRTLVGTIGLISAIPITTFLATIFFNKEKTTKFFYKLRRDSMNKNVC